MSKPIVVIACMLSSSESWEPQTAPTSLALTCRWRSRPQHHERTLATLFDHLIGDLLKMQWHVNTKCPGGFEIDDQFEFSRLLYRQISRLFALENLAGINAHLTVYVGKSRSVAHQSTRNDEVADLIHGWE